MLRHRTTPAAERFWPKVDMSGDCWLWTGALDTDGYGVFRYDGKRQGHAHRFAYEQAYGPISDSRLFACHICDTPRCCRPTHLFLGTVADNSADMSRKGRAAQGERHGSALHPETIVKGERHGMSRLAAVEVLQIRALAQTGMLGKDIAARYGVTPSVVSSVVRRKTWRHI